MTVFDAEAGVKLRDEGQELVTGRGTWIDDALALTMLIKKELPSPFAVEDIRRLLIEKGLPEPHHPNAWGAFGMSLSRKKIIERSGVWVNAKAKKSHACTVPLYNWV